ncbi:MAG: isoprenylcysteine carboxylmethyltransferase family protein [Thermincola sp.]|jgi:protein-S-isoprenylcysteine O-methyltransferase Ste14|nr:isoprenylcysteine carboxylmethyltransferase family protein [Thermincola sp.]MDT3703800.1 isoprenylcysteine carboxylmethyltransferase family protein [Thermincola sp.]
MKKKTDLTAAKAYRIPAIMMIVLGLILFLPAGSLRFWQAWIFWCGISALTVFIAAYFLHRDPALLSRRMKIKDQENTRKPPAFLKLFFLGYMVPGLDFRFHWSAMPVWLVITSNAIVFLGYILVFIVFMENSYAATVIQVEEEQQVITTGLYALVRHPMYLGMLIMSLFTPLALGSYWGIIPFFLTIPWTVIRIEIEEETLLRDLPGYKDYCLKTNYRLIPLIW